MQICCNVAATTQSCEGTPILELSVRRKRLIRTTIVGLCTLFVLGLVASWIVAGQLVAPCAQDIGNPPQDLPAVSISLASESGSTIAGWDIPSEHKKGVVILLHGIRGTRLTMLDRARMLHAEGYSIVMIDLQAHGESPGEHITVGYRERHDVRAAVEFVHAKYPEQPVGVIGASLGGASALLASPLGIDALVLESVYPNIRSAVHNRVDAQLGPLSTIPVEILLLQLKPRLGVSPSELRPADYVAKVECPIFLMSGTEDRHTTPKETEAMFSRAQEPKQLWLVEGAPHVDLYEADPTQYKVKVLQFLEQHLRKTP